MNKIKFSDRRSFSKLFSIESICFLVLIVMLLIDFSTRHSEWDQSVAYQRATRMLNGETPYQDFFLLYLPLSVYLNSLFLHIHNSFLTIKIIGFFVCLYILFIIYFTTKQVTLSRISSLVTITLTYFFAFREWPESNYSWYSVAAIVTALFVILRDYNLTLKKINFDSKVWLCAGIFLGVSFCLKHNFAIIISAAIIIFLIVNVLDIKDGQQKKALYAILGLALGLLGPLILMVIYLASNQVLTDAYNDIFGGASSYVEYMTFSYLNVISVDRHLLTQFSLQSWQAILKVLVAIAAPLVGPFILIFSFLNRQALHRQLLIFLGLTCSASFFFLFPRADYAHLAFALPVLLTGAVISFSITPIQYKWKQIVFKIVLICLLFVSLATTIEKAINISKGNLKYMPISASFVEKGVERDIQITLDSIKKYQSIGKKVIILDPSLSMYYPFLKMSNPTRYDFPTKGNFGSNNGKDTIAYIKNNSNICLFVSKNTAQEEFYPSEIVNSIKPTMKTKNSIGKWNIYCQESIPSTALAVTQIFHS